MDINKKGRMLLAHNFNLTEDILPQLTRIEFTNIFSDYLKDHKNITFHQLNHPHWMVEILFNLDEINPFQVGELCIQALVEKRKSQIKNINSLPNTLFLAGKKTTPPISDNPEGLQTGEWGVDLVETTSADEFLREIGWQEKTAHKTENEVFKIINK